MTGQFVDQILKVFDEISELVKIDPRSKDFAVPPLMIQTLVENGIKHGISKLKKGGEISLETQVKDSVLYIKIRNNGQLTHKNLNGIKGLGIENTRQRLKLLYGNKATFSIFNEDENTLLKKIKEATDNGLKIVYCIQNETQKIPKEVKIAAYEPISAIGTGSPDDPEHIEKVFDELKKGFDGRILYGGSVNSENVRDYIYIKNCGGLLVGGASLEINSFISLLSQW